MISVTKIFGGSASNRVSGKSTTGIFCDCEKNTSHVHSPVRCQEFFSNTTASDHHQELASYLPSIWRLPTRYQPVQLLTFSSPILIKHRPHPRSGRSINALARVISGYLRFRIRIHPLGFGEGGKAFQPLAKVFVQMVEKEIDFSPFSKGDSPSFISFVWRKSTLPLPESKCVTFSSSLACAYALRTYATPYTRISFHKWKKKYEEVLLCLLWSFLILFLPAAEQVYKSFFFSFFSFFSNPRFFVFMTIHRPLSG